MRHNCRIMNLLLVLACFLILGGCAGTPVGVYRSSVPPQAKERFAEAMHELSLENREKAVDTLETLVHQFPEYVDAHRRLQDLYIEDNRYGYLVDRYSRWTQKNPASPIFTYLKGRLLSNPDMQVEAFSRSVEKDPAFFWGYNGLGYAYRNSGRFEASESAYRKAIQSAPTQVMPHIGLASLYLGYRKLDEAGDALTEALTLFPEDIHLHMLHFTCMTEREGVLASLKAQTEISLDLELPPEFFRLMLRTLDKASTEGLIRKILYRFGPLAEGTDRDQEDLNVLLGICCRKLGNLGGALRYFSRVYAASPGYIRARRELRYVLAVTGRMREAYAVQVGDCPREWLVNSRLHEHSKEIIRISEALNARGDGSCPAEEGYGLARLLAEMGWLDEAAFFLSLAADQAGEAGASAARLLDDIYRHRNLEMALQEFFLSEYRDYSAGGRSQSFDDAVEALGKISEEILGCNLFSDLKCIEFTWVGRLMDPRPSAGNRLADYFRRFNRLFLFGQKSGGPVEAYLLDIFDYGPEQSGNVEGVEIEYDLIRCENLRIPSYIEYQGGNIVGAGLHSILFINLDAIRDSVYAVQDLYTRFSGRESLLLDDPAPEASTGMDVLDTREPLGLAARLYYLSFKEKGDRQGAAAYMADRFDTVLTHELRHLADARLFLPVTNNLFWKLYHFTLKGLSSFNIEAWLEERAQLNALLNSRDTYVALAEIADHLGGGERFSPHQKGYTDLISRMVRYIYDHPDHFPRIDRGANILHQLHKLSPEEILSIARTLAMEEGFIAEE